MSGQAAYSAPKAPTSDNNNNNKGINKKRARSSGNDAYQTAYAGFTFEPVPATGRPGTPHSFFKASYQVQYPAAAAAAATKLEGADDTTTNNTSTASTKTMRVHQHVNGLCVVTLGEALLPYQDSNNNSTEATSAATEQADDSGRNTIQFQVLETPDMSAAQKRKRGAKQLKGRMTKTTVEAEAAGAVRPSDQLVTIVTTSAGGQQQQQQPAPHSVDHRPCCVFGSVLELNRNLTIGLLETDPLLKGYLAVILPTGPFPPRASPCDEAASTTNPDDDDDNDES
jgi:hypothetical protein